MVSSVKCRVPWEQVPTARRSDADSLQIPDKHALMSSSAFRVASGHPIFEAIAVLFILVPLNPSFRLPAAAGNDSGRRGKPRVGKRTRGRAGRADRSALRFARLFA